MRRPHALLVAAVGIAVALIGVAAIYPPAALIAAGIAIAWGALFAVEVKP